VKYVAGIGVWIVMALTVALEGCAYLRAMDDMNNHNAAVEASK